MITAAEAKGRDRFLDLKSFLAELEKAGRISAEQCEQVLALPRPRDKQSVLACGAEQNLHDLERPPKKLDIETLTQFLADLAGQDYWRIDPLQLDAARVTQVMSYAFTQRHRILAVEVGAFSVTIAS